ncbi:MAG: hypothetical protein LBC26_06675 [Oscillospiraceae bacterium]|jgi:hypothetical protein|nr:hypothetical protein [Oscillospiraceae bacterium]
MSKTNDLAAQLAAAKACEEELVSYRLYKGPGVDPAPVTVMVNGETIRLQRGATVKIKRKFARVLDFSQEQGEYVMDLKEAARAEFDAAQSAGLL